MMQQNYVADGSFKKRIPVGKKFSWHLVVIDLALIKDPLHLMCNTSLKCGHDYYKSSQLCELLSDG